MELQRISDPDEIEALRTIIHWHRHKTRSWRASQLLSEWSRMYRAFWRVSPQGMIEQEQAPTTTARDFAGVPADDAKLVWASR